MDKTPRSWDESEFSFEHIDISVFLSKLRELKVGYSALFDGLSLVAFVILLSFNA